MKILGMIAEGFKKIKFVELKIASEGLTFIKGDNEEGKTSIIDCMKYLLLGNASIDSKDVINKDKSKLKATLLLDDIKVERTKTHKSDQIKITDQREGRKLDQKFLTSLVNEITFNPFTFLNKDGKGKLKFILKFLNIDTTSIDKEIDELKADRLISGRELKRLPNPDVSFDLKELETKQAKISDKCNSVTSMRDKLNGLITSRDSKVNSYEYKAKIDLERINQIKHQIVLLKKELDERESAYDELVNMHKEEIDILNKRIENGTNKINARLDGRKIDEMIDELTLIDNNISLANKQEAYDKKKKEYDDYSSKIKEQENKKLSIYAESSKGLIDGLEIKEDGIYFNGIYSEQWSTSQGIRIACDLCLAANPKLKAVFIDDGERFGTKKLKALEKWAIENDMQCIISVVDDKVPDEIPDFTYYIEDGSIKNV